MNRTILLTATLAGAVLSGCATQTVNTFQPFQAKDLKSQLRSGALIQKTNSFYVINDSSSSMSDAYQGAGFSGQPNATKLSIEKELLKRMNQTIPNISLSSGLRSFGFGPCLSWSYTHLNQPVQTYSSSAFDSALNTLECSSGGTPVVTAFDAASNDLTNASGNIALILFSDGHNYDFSPIPAVQNLKELYGDKLCVYTVWVGNENERDGQTVLNQLVNTGQCGFATDAEAISSSQGMAYFVKNVFFQGGTARTPVPTPGDSDGDGVIDANDKCPDTPKGAIVNKDGCWAFHGPLFDIDSAEVKSKYSPLITNAVKVLGLNPGLTVEIQGHTDSTGADSYNQGLSERRAVAVKNELVKQGIDGNRITTVGFGESRPVASNHNAEGRTKNRRVVYKRTDR